jgi:hypothetical protein
MISEDKMKNPIMKKLAVSSRHYNITTLLITQYTHLVPPVLRANSHYNIFFDIDDEVQEMKAVYDAFRQRLKNYETFKKYYYNNIENHKFIMWNNEAGEYKTFKYLENIPKFILKYNKKIEK